MPSGLMPEQSCALQVNTMGGDLTNTNSDAAAYNYCLENNDTIHYTMHNYNRFWKQLYNYLNSMFTNSCHCSSKLCVHDT